LLGVIGLVTCMPIGQFTAFYPSRPFWAGSKVNFADQTREGWFHDQMVEEVFSQDTDAYKIKVSRDGRIMLRVEALEQEYPEAHTPIEQTVKRWGEYLDYLNAFYLLLDSSTIELSGTYYFNLHEITFRDAFRVRYEGGKCVGENVAIESIASVFQMGRHSSSYRLGIPIELDPQITMRQVISLDVIQHASSAFAKVVAAPGLEKTLASFAKSLSEYKVGNYETCVVLSWFITETAVSRLWRTHIDKLNSDLIDGRKRVNRERSDFFTGRDFPVSVVSNVLELWGTLSYDQFQDIDAVRRSRNKIVHGHNFAPDSSDARLAMKTAQAMIDRLWGLRFKASVGYSVTSL
jgi:hypothetical protein